MKHIRLGILVILLIGMGYYATLTYHEEQRKLEIKKDLIELSEIKYGLFSVDQWKDLSSGIISNKIQEFNLDDANKDEMRRKVSNLLNKVITDLERSYHEKELGKSNIKGLFKSLGASAFNIFGHIKQDVPKITEQIVTFLDENENREAIRTYLINKINQYADDTFSETDYSLVNEILEEYGYETIDEAKVGLQEQVNDIDELNDKHKIIMVALAVVLLLLVAFSRKPAKIELAVSLIISLILLLLGVILPMIEIDARISEMNFSLLGEEILFTDQVLFYQSKSILEVVQLMMANSKIDLIAVGVLILTFSVLFPLSKLICSFFYLYSQKMRKNGLILFMVMKSGKWSMADVMVVAIFMAYIGFDGIVSEQLGQLQNISHHMDLLTTNQSHLLFGFYAFTLFVLLSLFISQKIKRGANAAKKLEGK